jgi:hypothetical protein
MDVFGDLGMIIFVIQTILSVRAILDTNSGAVPSALEIFFMKYVDFLT